ncbi:hypothetical protein PC116_g21810 [Phytophthora cactorum]|nr:hypothetical protein PC111_g14332 [Phytophthora cactorum]KAG2906571.1 hypothetical protein PC114_g11085 [Phytophthora cactorum]KAG2907691.1 hypothetical protein PC115_g13798 [Phytophthora cactorum]KAG2921220.1 hypothetical protein PC117_g16292 [Phytophthora cactorum]KAG2982750.1 hypothetical protein PC118_g9790 [Phytophthora cactorum]
MYAIIFVSLVVDNVLRATEAVDQVKSAAETTKTESSTRQFSASMKALPTYGEIHEGIYENLQKRDTSTASTSRSTL